jgi:serine protease Do
MNNLQKSVTAIALVAVLLPVAARAQKDKTKEKDKKEGVEQIIITRDNDKTDKLVIEVTGDKVTINGKPADEYKDGDVTVNRNKYKEMSGLQYAPRARAYSKGGTRSLGSDDNVFMWDEDDNRAMLGVVTENEDNGAMIKEVTKESGAEKAGLKEGDIIKKIDDVKIEDADDVTKTIRTHKPGDKVTVTIMRDKKEQKITAELSKWKGMRIQRDGFGDAHNFNFNMPEFKMEDLQSLPRIQGDNYGRVWDAYNGHPKLGISVQDTEDGKGVKVIDVDDESNAQKAGIKEEDVITSINDTEVNSADEVAKIVRDNKEKISIKVKLNRDGKSQTIDVKMPRKLKTAEL